MVAGELTTKRAQAERAAAQLAANRTRAERERTESAGVFGGLFRIVGRVHGDGEV